MPPSVAERHQQHQRPCAPAPSRASIHRRAARNRTSPRRRAARRSASSSASCARSTRAHSIGVSVSETKPDTMIAIAMRDREFAEHAADDAAHQQHRDEHRDQRERDRDDGEADLARALQRGLERPHAALDVADDVLQHDDGVVDHEADRQRQRQQRHVVDGDSRARTSPRRCRSARSAPPAPE